jgi:hypothetical protein
MKGKLATSFHCKRTAISIAVLAAISAGASQAAVVVHKDFKTFSVYNTVGTFTGATFGNIGNGRWKTMLCGSPTGGDIPSLPACDAEHQPVPGDQAAWLYPVDSEFGFHVVPYALAYPKTIGDGVWGEGWVGNIYEPGTTKVIGVEVSNVDTDTFQVPAGMGTWCSGIGGSSVKCSTEHYTVMEHVLTCHETVAYIPENLNPNDFPRANPIDGSQAVLTYPLPEGGTGTLDCASTKLDNNLLIKNASNTAVDGKKISEVVWDGTTLIPSNTLSFLEANESTVLDDIAIGSDYSITAKDDGKALYRWGNLIKRPNDLRFYHRLALPAAWKTGGTCQAANGGAGCRIIKAELHITHNITNNPNDQVRPEDMENEGAIGRLPGYNVDNTYGTGSLVSDTFCYEGDGDAIPTGVVLKNADMAVGGTDSLVTESTDYVNAEGNPYAWSGDLENGLSNAWYTSVDREPFEWSYDTDSDGAADVSYRKPLSPIPAGTTLLSGPRWRLTPGKFGQDLPALDIPNVNCAPPPYVKALIKYPVGDATVTRLNMLDWNPSDERSVIDPATTQPVSPLTFSNGWVSPAFNEGTVIQPGVTLWNSTLTGVTVNGAPVSQDFDLSIYIKGDKKPTQLYGAWLYIEYEAP